MQYLLLLLRQLQWHPKLIGFPRMFSRPFRLQYAPSLRWLVNLIAFVRWLARIIAASFANQNQKAPCWLFSRLLRVRAFIFKTRLILSVTDWAKWVDLTFVLSPNKRCPQLSGWTLLAQGTTGSRTLIKWKRLKSILFLLDLAFHSSIFQPVSWVTPWN